MTAPDDIAAPLQAADLNPHPSDPLWYKDALIYQLHVKAFFDSDDDGVGDFQGLRRKLDYLQDLGVTALWLLPFYPSPLRDDGYDIGDYRDVHPNYGRMADFKAFVRDAHARGLKVITELVVNHTSDQHPWFQRARHAKPGSPLRDFYVWSDTDQKFPETRIIFLDTEKSNWTWDPVAGAYYWHRFYSHQPDLNFDNPRVFRAVVDVMKFWLDLGVDAMRLDAVPYLIEREGTNNENLPETHQVLKNLRRELDARYGDRMLLAEANQWPEDVLQYFGDGDECHMAFHFPLMPRLYMAVATEDRHPVTDIMRQTPDIPENCQWAIFLRNHDELTLEMVTDRERDYLWNHYAADRRARINLGIRRRLAALMENDRRKIELLNGLLFSMPGTPVMYYGDEIGMGDNVFLGDRDGVRTPMQWSLDRNGGFSRADPARLFLPAIMDPVYGYQAVNVEAQARSPSSLLNWMKRLIAARRSRQAFGRGSLRFLYPSNRKVIAFLRCYQDEIILCVANLSRSPQAAELDLSEFRGREPIELFGRTAFPRVQEAAYPLTLQGHSFFWFDLAAAGLDAAGGGGVSGYSDAVTLVMPHGWADLFGRHNLPQLESDVIPSFLPAQRWFGAKHDKVMRARVIARGEITRADGGNDDSRAADPKTGRESYLAAVVEAELRSGERQRYFLPMSTIWAPSESDQRQVLAPVTLAALRQFRKEGALVDALSQDAFVMIVAEALRRGGTLALDGGEIRCIKTALFDQFPMPEQLLLRRSGAEQSNSSVFFEEYGMLKFYRRLNTGPHPEIEMSRFLVEKAGYANSPPPLATLELSIAGENGPETMALGVLFGFVRNQGDGWAQALNYLVRYLDDALLKAQPGAGPQLQAEELEPDHLFLDLARQLGIRTAEMHRALAEKAGDDPDFKPEPITSADLKAWRAEVEKAARAMVSAVDRAKGALTSPARELADALVSQQSALIDRVRSLLPDGVSGQKTRFHGDYHLGQVIVVQNDVYLIDFEGEPARNLAERRGKSSPLRDVAGMLRSFDYASVAAVRQLAETRATVQPQLAALAEIWRRNATDRFLAAYRETMRGCAAYPRSDAEADDMIAFFALQKAVSEVGYELANRPAWLAIPLKGIMDIVNGGNAINEGAADAPEA